MNVRERFEKDEIDAVTIREVLGEHEIVWRIRKAGIWCKI